MSQINELENLIKNLEAQGFQGFKEIQELERRKLNLEQQISNDDIQNQIRAVTREIEIKQGKLRQLEAYFNHKRKQFYDLQQEMKSPESKQSIPTPIIVNEQKSSINNIYINNPIVNNNNSISNDADVMRDPDPQYQDQLIDDNEEIDVDMESDFVEHKYPSQAQIRPNSRNSINRVQFNDNARANIMNNNQDISHNNRNTIPAIPVSNLVNNMSNAVHLSANQSIAESVNYNFATDCQVCYENTKGIFVVPQCCENGQNKLCRNCATRENIRCPFCRSESVEAVYQYKQSREEFLTVPNAQLRELRKNQVAYLNSLAPTINQMRMDALSQIRFIDELLANKPNFCVPGISEALYDAKVPQTQTEINRFERTVEASRKRKDKSADYIAKLQEKVLESLQKLKTALLQHHEDQYVYFNNNYVQTRQQLGTFLPFQYRRQNFKQYFPR